MYSSRPTVDPLQAAAALSAHLDRSLPPDRILLLAAILDDAALAAAAADPYLQDRIPTVTRYIRTPVLEAAQLTL